MKQSERLAPGMVVQHFKSEMADDSRQHVYRILHFAEHTETGEKLVIYQPLIHPEKICARPYDMFMSKVDKEKYPAIKQEYRFEKAREICE